MHIIYHNTSSQLTPSHTHTYTHSHTHNLPYSLQGVDTLTPLGRGQAQLLTGPPGCLQHDTALDIILGQAGSDVQCVYAAVGKTAEETRRAVELLSQHGALEYTTVGGVCGGKGGGSMDVCVCMVMCMCVWWWGGCMGCVQGAENTSTYEYQHASTYKYCKHLKNPSPFPPGGGCPRQHTPW